MIARILALTVVTVFAGYTAESQTKTPENTQPEQQAQPTQEPPSSDLRGTPDSPIVVEVLEAQQTQEESARIEAERQEEAAARWWTIKLTGVIALFTFCLVIVGGLQWRTYQATLAASRVIERAYVDMSHEPPGLRIDDFAITSQSKETHLQPGMATQHVRIRVRVTNHGNTPGRVIRVLIQPMWVIGSYPTQPTYNESQATEVNAFLVRTKKFYETRDWWFPEADLERLRMNPVMFQLCVIGYVDYIDNFRKRHRAGYGRVYDPSRDNRAAYQNPDGTFNQVAWDKRNNLPFLTAPGYNYDIEIDEHGRSRDNS